MSAPTRRLARSMNTLTSPYFSTQAAIGGGDEKISNNNSTSISMSTSTQAKRKAKSSPTSKNNNKKKSKSKSPVERTQSFEPAWWGNVLVSGDNKNLHSHVASAAITSTPTKSDIQKSYPPVHTLILGTHPSIASLDKNEMFGHPLNAFWYIAGDALGFRRSEAISSTTKKPYKNLHEHLRYDTSQILEYPQQLEQMVSKGFAMWDIVASCEREGSLDTDIEHEVANPIRQFCEGREHLGGGIKRIVIANGTTGAKYFVKHFTTWFVDGKLRAANDEMSQRVFKTVMNKARKANGSSFDDDIDNGNLIEVVCLPGVSPAAAKFTYLEKRDAWEKGCYGPGLDDYEAWKQSMEESETTKPNKTKRYVTPAKQTNSKSPKKSPTRSPSKAPTVRIVSSDLTSLAPENEWVDLEIPAQELRPSSTLINGQCFNWIVVETEIDPGGPLASQSPQKSAWGTHDAKEWVGPLGRRVLYIQETPTTTRFRVLHGDTKGAKEDLQKYFRLETPLAPLYKEWSAQDKRLAKIAKAIPGVRILRQDPLECTLSFICSSNNNIPRITQMLSFFRKEYGTFMMEIPTRQENSEESSAPLFLYAFPTLSSLVDATEDTLRSNGFGYRAKYIIETRNLLEERGGNDFLLKLRKQQNPEVVQEELTKFSGIGRKVADCIALFSLDQDDAIPVDVHVQHIASRDYDPTVLGEAKSLTPTIYKRIGDLFRDRFKNKSGWAHSLLFVAELPSFRYVLPQDVVREMDEWREHEKRKKQEMKEESKSKKAKVSASI